MTIRNTEHFFDQFDDFEYACHSRRYIKAKLHARADELKTIANDLLVEGNLPEVDYKKALAKMEALLASLEECA